MTDLEMLELRLEGNSYADIAVTAGVSNKEVVRRIVLAIDTLLRSTKRKVIEPRDPGIS